MAEVKVDIPKSAGLFGPAPIGHAMKVSVTKNAVEAKPVMTKQEALKIEAALEKAFSSSYGLSKIAKALAEPIKLYLDQMAIGRQLVVIDQKNEGELAYYDFDIHQYPMAVSVAKDGNSHIVWIKADRTYVDYFVIAANAKFPLDELKWRRYNILERGKERLKQAIGIKEDLQLFRLLSAAAKHDITAATGFRIDVMAEAMALLDQMNLIPYALVIHPYILSHFRKWKSAHVDEVARIEIRQTGYLGELFGVNLFISRILPYDSQADTYTCYLTTLPKYLGVMPFWADLEILASNNLDELAVGFLAWEMLGMQIWNPRGVVKLNVARAFQP